MVLLLDGIFDSVKYVGQLVCPWMDGWMDGFVCLFVCQLSSGHSFASINFFFSHVEDSLPGSPPSYFGEIRSKVKVKVTQKVKNHINGHIFGSIRRRDFKLSAYCS